MADRGEVKIREGKLGDLIKLYRRAYKSLTITILDATEAGKINKARVMLQVRRILTELGDDVETWVKEEIPQYYRDGANHAIQDLRAAGVSVEAGMTVIDTQAIAALVDEINLAFAEGITAISRNSRRILNDALKRQLQFIIADGRLKGETLRIIAGEIKARLKAQGISVLVDRGGKRWDFDTYANMLIRTKAVEARNQGLANRMLEAGQDLVQVSNHNSSHRECAVWEGKILSVTGRTAGYPTVEDARTAGLFHPNCQHAINVINLDLARKTKAYDNPFNTR